MVGSLVWLFIIHVVKAVSGNSLKSALHVLLMRLADCYDCSVYVIGKYIVVDVGRSLWLFGEVGF